VILSAKDGGLLLAAAFSGAHAATEGSIDLENFKIRLFAHECHIERMAGGKPASAAEIKIFLGFQNYFLSVQILKVGFGLAAEEFLPPSPAVLSNLHRIAGPQRVPHGGRPQTPVHFFASW